MADLRSVSIMSAMTLNGFHRKTTGQGLRELAYAAVREPWMKRKPLNTAMLSIASKTVQRSNLQNIKEGIGV